MIITLVVILWILVAIRVVRIFLTAFLEGQTYTVKHTKVTVFWHSYAHTVSAVVLALAALFLMQSA